MKRRIVFRADASKKTGYGHFIRSLALAGYLMDDFDCFFASFNSDTENHYPTDSQLKQIEEICNPLQVEGLTLEDYNDNFLKEIRSSDIVVLDNYYYSTEYQKSIKSKGCKLVCVDDVHNRHMVCDILITACPLQRNEFSLESYTRFIGGIEFALLRKPFFNPVAERNVSKKIDCIVLGMGGADAFNLTDKITSIVHEVMPTVKIDVIAGNTVSISDKTKSIADVHRNLNANQIVTLMDRADLGLFPASTICMEAMSRRLPVIAGYYVDNQKELYDYCSSRNYVSSLGNLLDKADELKDRLMGILKGERPHPININFAGNKEEIRNLFFELRNS